MKPLAILWARRWIVLVTMLVVFAAAGLALALMQKSYTATARVLVDPRPTDAVTGSPSGAVFIPTYMATQVDVIQSQRVAARAVALLKLEEVAAARARYAKDSDGQVTFSTFWADVLLRNLDVRPARDSNLIELSYSGPDAAFAAEVANAFAKAYVETSLELRVDPAREVSGFFAERTKQFRADLEAAQARLSAFQKRSGIISLDERLDVENARLQELSTQLVGLQAQSVDAAKRASSAEQSLREGGATLPEVQASTTIQTLKVELARLQARESDLEQRLGANHPQRVSLRAEVEQLQQRLNNETSLAARSIRKSSEVSNQRETQLQAALEAQKSKVLQLKKQRDELTVLQRDVESQQRSYELLKQRLVQTSLESQSSHSNLAVLDPATVPREPSSPRVLLIMMAACFLAPLAGAGAALFAELTDPRLRSVSDIESMTGVRLLACVPSPGQSRGLSVRAPSRLRSLGWSGNSA
jgi:chain length determinant protein EpsF